MKGVNFPPKEGWSQEVALWVRKPLVSANLLKYNRKKMAGNKASLSSALKFILDSAKIIEQFK